MTSALTARQEQSDEARSRFPTIEQDENFWSPTNVWGIGMVMWELMHVHEWPETENVQYRIDGNIIKEIRTGKTPEYSRELRDLVRDCLKAVPDARPELQVIKERIDAAMRNLTRHRLNRSQVSFTPTHFHNQTLGTIPPNAHDIDAAHVLHEQDNALKRNFPHSELIYNENTRYCRILPPNSQIPTVPPGWIRWSDMPQYQRDWVMEYKYQRLSPKDVFGEVIRDDSSHSRDNLDHADDEEFGDGGPHIMNDMNDDNEEVAEVAESAPSTI